LWRSDGTPRGTFQVADLRRGGGTSFPLGLIAFQERAYFFADDGTGWGLWHSDGSARGTEKVKGVATGLTPSFIPEMLGTAGGHLIFQAQTAQRGNELWRSDGTAAGTVPSTDL